MSIVQLQWSLDRSVFATVGVLVQLLQTSRDEDIQSSAVMALEALGSGMMVCPDRVDDGHKALGAGESEFFKNILVNVGLKRDGIASFIRKTAPRCIPAFLLVTSLKTFLDDEQIGSVFHEMLNLQGLLRKPELICSREQLRKVISAVSGYSDNILPPNTMRKVLEALNSTKPSSKWMTRALEVPNLKTLAKLYSAVFGALQKDDVTIITLRGSYSCVHVASTLMWLQEEDTQLVVNDEVVIGCSGQPKISINLSTERKRRDYSWNIQEWRETTEISSLVVTEMKEYDSGEFPNFFVPISSAKATIQAAYQLSESEIAQVGKIATGLVLYVTERGLIDCGAFGTLPSRLTKLQEICQTSYLSRVLDCMLCYGWKAAEVHGATAISEEIIEWVDHIFKEGDEVPDFSEAPTAIDHLEPMLNLIADFSKTSSAFGPVIEHEVAEAATFMATHSLFSSICSRFPHRRFFKFGGFDTMERIAGYMLNWIILDAIRSNKSLPETSASLVTFNVFKRLNSQDLRRECMASLIPGAELNTEEGIKAKDLAYAMNGYIALSSQLGKISLSPRDVMAVELRPGHIRSSVEEHDNVSFLKISVDGGGPEFQRRDDDFAELYPLRPFDAQGKYTGSFSFTGMEHAECKFVHRHTNRVLTLRAVMFNSETGYSSPVSWVDSIDRIAGATHLMNETLPGFSERALAETWENQQLWSQIFTGSALRTWADDLGEDEEPMRFITNFYGDETIRFFCAGMLINTKLYVCHGSCSVVKCVQIALDDANARETESQLYSSATQMTLYHRNRNMLRSWNILL